VLRVLLRVGLIFIAVLLVLRALGRMLGGLRDGVRGSGHGGSGRPPAPTPVKMAQDPVCGTFVVPGKALSLSDGGTTQWFCSESCRAKFSSRA